MNSSKKNIAENYQKYSRIERNIEIKRVRRSRKAVWWFVSSKKEQLFATFISLNGRR